MLPFSRLNDDSETSAFDECSNSLLRLNNSTIVFMKEVSYALALICIWREENFGKSGKRNKLSHIQCSTLTVFNCIFENFLAKRLSIKNVFLCV